MRDVLLGLLVGLFSGLFGVGGGIILVPLMVLLMRADQKQAQATSLVVVALGASSGAITYAVGDSVSWASVPFLIAGGLLGSWIGTVVVKKAQVRWLQLLFAALLVVTALRIGLDSLLRSNDVIADFSPLVALGLAASGFVMGLLSSLLGVGGGIIVIPLLVAIFGFPQQLAAGTSLVTMIPLALFAAFRLTRSGFTQWMRGLQIGGGSIPGAVGGALLALALDPGLVQIGFGVLLIVAAASMARKALS